MDSFAPPEFPVENSGDSNGFNMSPGQPENDSGEGPLVTDQLGSQKNTPPDSEAVEDGAESQDSIPMETSE